MGSMRCSASFTTSPGSRLQAQSPPHPEDPADSANGPLIAYLELASLDGSRQPGTAEGTTGART